MTAVIIPFPGRKPPSDHLRFRAWGNIGCAALNEFARRELLTLRAVVEEQNPSLSSLRRFSFEIADDLMCISYIQISDCGVKLVRTNVFDIQMISFDGEEGELGGYRAVAATEHWFGLEAPELYESGQLTINMVVNPEYLPRLASIVVTRIDHSESLDSLLS